MYSFLPLSVGPSSLPQKCLVPERGEGQEEETWDPPSPLGAELKEKTCLVVPHRAASPLCHLPSLPPFLTAPHQRTESLGEAWKAPTPGLSGTSQLLANLRASPAPTAWVHTSMGLCGCEHPRPRLELPESRDSAAPIHGCIHSTNMCRDTLNGLHCTGH